MSPPAPLRAWELVLVGIALALLVAFAGRALVERDPGFDEVAHIGAAQYLRLTGSNVLNREHPPLIKALAAAGLALGDRLLGRESPRADAPSGNQWQVGLDTLYPGGRLDRARLTAARAPFLAIALLGALGVWWWSRLAFGPVAAALSIGLYSLSPTIHAHGTMVLTDLTLAVFALGALGATWRGIALASSSRIALGGALAAAAAMTKFTGPLVGACCGALIVLAAWRMPSGSRLVPLLGRLAVFGAAFAIAMVVLNGCDLDFSAYRAGMALVGANFDPNFRSVTWGVPRDHGVWFYFPLALGLKSTPAEIGAVLIAIIVVLSDRLARRPDALGFAAQLLFPLLYLSIFIAIGPNAGHRYMAPLYPFAFVLAGAAGAMARPLVARALCGALVLVQGAAALGTHGDPLSYFNGIAGCRGALAASCLDDSNIDWGQNIGRVWPAVGGALGADEKVHIGFYGAAPLAAYLPRYAEIETRDWVTPGPYVYVISAHYLVHWSAIHPELKASLFYRARAGAAQIGNSYLVYDLRPRAAASSKP